MKYNQIIPKCNGIWLVNAFPSPFSLRKELDLVPPKLKSGMYFNQNLRGKFANREVSGEYLVYARRAHATQKYESIWLQFPEDVLNKIDCMLLAEFFYSFAKKFALATAFVMDHDLCDVEKANFQGVSNLKCSWKFDYGMSFGVPSFQLSNYWTADFCHRTWGLSPEDVAKRIFDVVYFCKCFDNGVFYFAFGHAPSLEELVEFNRKMRARLGGYGMFNEVIDPSWNPMLDWPI